MSETDATQNASTSEAPQTTAADSEAIDLAQQFDPTLYLPESWQPHWEVVAQYPLYGAAIIVVLAYLLALASRGFFVYVLGRIAGLSETKVDNIILDGLKKPVFTTLLMLGFMIAVQVARLPWGSGVLLNLMASIIIVTWMLAGLHLSSAVVGHLSDSPKFTIVEPRTIPLFDFVVKLAVLLIASYVLLLVWGINPLGWLASAGIVGIAVGFAAKDTLANLFSGLFILADSPYKIGDFINLDSGERGMVTGIGMRSTRLLTRSDIEVTIPNAVIANAMITNESSGRHKKMRIRLPVGVAYGSDADQVCEILERVGVEHHATCADPAPRVRMRAFGASSLDFELLCWIDEPVDRGRISHQLFIEIYKAFLEANIEIPYAKQDLYIKEAPDFGEDN